MLWTWRGYERKLSNTWQRSDRTSVGRFCDRHEVKPNRKFDSVRGLVDRNFRTVRPRFSIQFSISSPVIVRNRRIEPKFGLLNLSNISAVTIFFGQGSSSTAILQIFGVVLFSVFSVVNGFTEIKKTPKCEKTHCPITTASTDTEIKLHKATEILAHRIFVKLQYVGKEVLANIAVILFNHGHTVAHLCASRKWLHCRREGATEEGSCSSQFTTSSVKTQIHTKKARRKRDGGWGKATRKRWRTLKVQPMKKEDF